MTEIRPVLGSKELYDELAASLNADENWHSRSKRLNISMIHIYLTEPPRAYRMEFVAGHMGNITELEDVSQAPKTDLVMSGPLEIWEQLLVTGELSVNTAMISRKIKVEGKLSSLMKNMTAFNYLLTKLMALDPRVVAPSPN